MIIAGTAYGVVLNDRAERAALAERFQEKPYLASPVAPVVYIKPRQCVRMGGAGVMIPAGVEALEAAPTVALLFGRDSSGAGWEAVAATCLALDISIPKPDYYRPSVAQRSAEGFLPLGGFDAPDLPEEIVTFIDGIEAHRWKLSRLVRDASALIADLSSFMTLRAGDLLLLGLPGDAPLVRAGQSIRVQAAGLPTLSTMILQEAA